MIEAKNIYLSHDYKSPYNVILIDQCVSLQLADYLKATIPKYFKKTFEIVHVCQNSLMKGMLDRDLGDFCYDYNGVLITADHDFFKKYYGYKILYSEGLKWSIITQKTVKFLENNSSIKK